MNNIWQVFSLDIYWHGCKFIYLFTKSLWLEIAGEMFIFQQDSAPAHRAQYTMALLAHETPRFIGPDLWPPGLPWIWNLLSIFISIFTDFQQISMDIHISIYIHKYIHIHRRLSWVPIATKFSRNTAVPERPFFPPGIIFVKLLKINKNKN